MRTAKTIDADLKAIGLVLLSDSARSLLLRMCEGDPLRLVVPVGDHGIFLIGDPRLHDSRREDVTDKAAVLELIHNRLIGELPEWSTWRKDPKAMGGKVGWREMFAGHISLIPVGAKVFALMQ